MALHLWFHTGNALSCGGEGLMGPGSKKARLAPWLVAEVLVALLLAGPCLAYIPVGKNATLIPLPEIIEDPNEGLTVGVLASLLMTDDKGDVRRILAPDVRYNSITGAYPMFRLFEYPAANQKILLLAGKATTVGEYFESTYVGQNILKGWLDLGLRAVHENDPFERFYGFGNSTPDSNERNYLGDNGSVVVGVGVNLPYSLEAITQTRLKVVRVRQGGVDKVRQLVNDPQFIGTPGITGATVVGQRFGLRFDTRDSDFVPTRGILGEVGVEIVDQALGASASYLRYGMEARSYFPFDEAKTYILASQAVLEYMQGGSRAPFFDRSSLGGVDSMRGFGSRRYVDNNRFFVRSELRTNVWEPSWLVDRFKTHGHLEISPFIELGQVFNSSRTFPLEDPHTVGGVSFRAVVPPQLVAYVDVGTTGGSPAVFTGIDYPF